MSFKAVWGFDPEDIDKAKARDKLADDFPIEFGRPVPGEDPASDDWAAGMPSGFQAQIYELRLIFRL